MSRSRRWLYVLCAVPLIAGAGMIVYSLSRPSDDAVLPTQGAPSGRRAGDAALALGDAPQEKVIGRWCRPDGGYVLQIESIAADGEARVAYFNPKPIRVATAKVSREGSRWRIFVELHDENYPGSIYRLFYDPARDRLQGTYYQAVARETYDIVFVRLKT